MSDQEAQAEPMILWRCLYQELDRDCDGFYPLPPVYVLAAYEDDAWNAADPLLLIPDGCEATGVVEARHATAAEAVEWERARHVPVEVTDDMVERAAKAINHEGWAYLGAHEPGEYCADCRRVALPIARAALSAALGGGE